MALQLIKAIFPKVSFTAKFSYDFFPYKHCYITVTSRVQIWMDVCGNELPRVSTHLSLTRHFFTINLNVFIFCREPCLKFIASTKQWVDPELHYNRHRHTHTQWLKHLHTPYWINTSCFSTAHHSCSDDKGRNPKNISSSAWVFIMLTEPNYTHCYPLLHTAHAHSLVLQNKLKRIHMRSRDVFSYSFICKCI